MSEPSTVEKIEREFWTWFRDELRGLTRAQIDEAKRYYLEQRVEWEASYGGIARWGAIIMIPTMIGVLPFAKWMEKAEENARKKTGELILAMRAENERASVEQQQ
jgi:cbb3-type cytochrome oxidase subunit 3